jgi:hypothetical protein
VSYHRDHIARFLQISATSEEQAKAILARAKAAVGISEEDGGIFSADNLARILGDPELVSEFDTLWNTGQLQVPG